MRAVAIAVLCVGLFACGASTSQQASTVKKPAPAEPKAEAPAPAAPATAAPAEAPPLPPNYDAGEIPRDKLMAVLGAGPGRFLQRVRVKKASDDQGRFAGWRIVELFPGEGGTNAIVPGDVVIRVNGQSVERPEQFKSVWDSLALSSELVVTVRRGAAQSDVRYRIVTEQLPP